MHIIEIKQNCIIIEYNGACLLGSDVSGSINWLIVWCCSPYWPCLIHITVVRLADHICAGRVQFNINHNSNIRRNVFLLTYWWFTFVRVNVPSCRNLSKTDHQVYKTNRHMSNSASTEKHTRHLLNSASVKFGHYLLQISSPRICKLSWWFLKGRIRNCLLRPWRWRSVLVRSSRKRKDGCSNPSRDRPKSLKQVVPLLNPRH